MVGQPILGYTVDEEIGAGGFGTVYKVSKTNASGKYVRALKHITIPTKKQYNDVLNSMGGDYSKADDYFVRVLQEIVSEIQILNQLTKSGAKNIVSYYENDINETGSPKTYDIYILMEYLTPLPDFISSRGFTVGDVVQLGRDIITALISCHSQKIIHRDIKDDNIFVSENGTYKLGDFGVSKMLKDRSHAESMKGTPNFIAPEVYLGKEKYDNSVDLYSLGIVLYRLLNGSRNPFMPEYPATYNTDDEDKAFEARMKGETPALPYFAKNILGEAVIKALLKRNDRYATAEEFLDAWVYASDRLSPRELKVEVCLKDIAFNSNSETIGSSSRNSSNETIGSATDAFAVKTSAPISDRNLFETMSEDSSQKVETQSSINNSSDKIEYTPQYEPYIPKTVEHKNVSSVSKQSFGWIPYVLPLVFILAYLITFFIVIPNYYGKAVSFIEWLFTGAKNIVETIKEPSNVLNPIYGIIALKFWIWFLLAGFVASLFILGHKLHNRKAPINENAKTIGKDAFLLSLEIFEEFKSIINTPTDKTFIAIRNVNDRLKNESSFGEGSSAVINCEDEIIACLTAIKSNLSGLRNQTTMDQSAKNIEILCQRIISKLKVRIELKKR